MRVVSTPASVIWQRLRDGVAGKFTMSLPLDHAIGNAQAQEIVRKVLQRQVLLARQLPQHLKLVFYRYPFAEHRHISDQCRNADARMRPGMYLGMEFETMGVVAG